MRRHRPGRHGVTGEDGHADGRSGSGVERTQAADVAAAERARAGVPHLGGVGHRQVRAAAEIAEADAHCDDSSYYERWLGSFERLLLETGVLSPDELDRRTAEFAAGVWDPHEHYETTSDATASSIRTPLRSEQRNIVWRSDGEAINVFRRPGQLFVCATGCCCGHVERGHFPVPVELYEREWARRKIRHKVHLSMGGCLGPCALSNVALLLYGGEQIWFHSIETDEHVLAIFDYIESMVRESSFQPPPDSLRDRVFDVFDWEVSAPALASIESLSD